MKKLFLILIIFAVLLPAQENNQEEIISPIVIYWKTLSPSEKEVFLFSYMTQVYDTYNGLRKELGYNGLTSWYYDNRAEDVFAVFDKLDANGIDEFVKWIDEFYSHEEYYDYPFNEALRFAFRFHNAAGETLWEKYENLKFDELKLK